MDSPYTLTRGPDAGEEQRLHNQHYNMWMPVAKQLLPPHIFGGLVKPDHPPAIADLATGTDGYDYDPSKFIEAFELPNNVRLFPGDILKPFPEQLRAQYDVIHVRMLILGLKADQWAEAAQNIKMLLRLGGWLVWEDYGHSGITCVPVIKEFALWSNAEVQYARSVGRDIIAPMRLLSQIQESGYVNCHESIYHSFGLPENLRKTTGRLFMAAARQILKGTLDKTESTIVKSHDEVDGIVDKVK
ncbi:hypothetical protein N5P37_008302 [Trichoderma harzianum]|nr:hypothetical protein N5P37_008302 [Trichoderma harzianum]